MTSIAAWLLLAILAHSLFMTSEVEAEARHESHAITATVSEISLSEPGHHQVCFTAQIAVKSTPIDLLSSELATPLPLRDPSNLTPSVAKTLPPHHPPNVVRALLQVFRI